MCLLGCKSETCIPKLNRVYLHTSVVYLHSIQIICLFASYKFIHIAFRPIYMHTSSKLA